jgi:hypothetical protein
MKPFVVATACAVFVVGCRRGATSSDGTAALSPSESASASTVPASRLAPTSLAEAIGRADLRVEARRGVLDGPDPILTRARSVIEPHFGTPVPYPLAYQVVTLGGGRNAVLLEALHGERRPFVALLDEKQNPVWVKQRPIGGVKDGVSELSLAPGPGDHVLVAWCNASSDSVALRRWAEDGEAFADYDALHVESCDRLSILYWPQRGWVIAAAGPHGAVAQLVSENGEYSWGRDGAPLPWTSSAPAPLSLSLDTPDTLLFFRLGRSGGPGTADYLFAMRWGADGRPLWPGPLSVKRLDVPVDPNARAIVEPGDGVLRATLPSSAPGAHDIVVEVASDGVVTRR